jgi:hypothetical protein
MTDPKVIIRLLEDRGRPRGSKMTEEDLMRLAKLAEDNVRLLEDLGCWKIEGDVIYYRIGCLGSYYPD